VSFVSEVKWGQDVPEDALGKQFFRVTSPLRKGPEILNRLFNLGEDMVGCGQGLMRGIEFVKFFEVAVPCRLIYFRILLR
jgi:hypothetical protein